MNLVIAKIRCPGRRDEFLFWGDGTTFIEALHACLNCIRCAAKRDWLLNVDVRAEQGEVIFYYPTGRCETVGKIFRHISKTGNRKPETGNLIPGGVQCRE